MNKEALKQRTKQFAHRCVKLSLSLPKNLLSQHISKQLIRCSTSVAANYRAACISQSKPSFISKIGLVAEEADESHFWIEFLLDEKLLHDKKCRPLLEEAKELTLIFTASQKTARGNHSI
jgi:four helix bundle protein